ncbi:hypothetical protein [Flavobacterium rhizosphaerae]|uniref:DUF5050 domain-containing protein n=1 Tax=Flavobacterium rhizosphaerae TaxID=3163298 RepID=A0ABW8YRY2_9FLAO
MKNIVLILVLLTAITTGGQEILPVKQLTNTEASIDSYVGTDAFGWQYTIAENEFHKTKDGRTLKYKNVALGDIYKVDIQSPLQIVLFYKKQNTAVLLDNQLNETNRINFSISKDNQPELVAEAVGLASQNRLWVYDIISQQVGLYDIAQSTFKTITPPSNDGITYYASDYNYFYWTDNNNLCRRVNVFGRVDVLGTVPVFDYAQLTTAKQFIYSKNNNIYIHNFNGMPNQQIQLTEKSIQSFYYTAQILTIFTGTQITSYQITLP